MGRRMLAISPSILVQLCKRHDGDDRTYSVANPIPDDAKIVAAYVTPQGTMEVALESREWPAQKHPRPEPLVPPPAFTVRYLPAGVAAAAEGPVQEGTPLETEEAR